MPHLLGVTLTGLDASTDLSRALALSQRHPLLEWGILLGGTETPRYPSISFIEQWARHAHQQGVSTAMHLCGKFARAWIDNDPAIVDLSRQFGRIQVNVVASRIDVDRLVAAIESGRHPNVITQHNDANITITQRLATHPAHSILFDASGGRGVGPTSWPDPIEGKVCGYAGGLGPSNVAGELDQIAQRVGTRPFWIDMEGKVRTPEDILDLDACAAVLAEVDRWVSQSRPSPPRLG